MSPRAQQHPLTSFEDSFRTAEILLRVYRLLHTEGGPFREHELLDGVRTLLQIEAEEELLLFLNNMFVGVIREQADVRRTYFREERLALLLRQAVTTACTSLDVYLENLLKYYLPSVIRAKQRNFLPDHRTVRSLFRHFRLELPDVLRLVDAGDPYVILAQQVLRYLERQTLANMDGMEATCRLLGLNDPWQQIADRLGRRDQDVRDHIQALIRRRHDIVHRGDRPMGDDDVQRITLEWAESHVDSLKHAIRAVDNLTQEAMEDILAALPAEA